METIHFLVISPYRGMNELVHEVLLTEPQVQADCYVANLTEVDSLLVKRNLLNYDAIISRGGTAAHLKEHVSLPVLRYRALVAGCPACNQARADFRPAYGNRRL